MVDWFRNGGTGRPWLAKVAGIGAALVLASPAGAATRASPSPGAAAVAASPRSAQASSSAALDSVEPGWRFGPALGLAFGVGSADFEGLVLRIDAEREVSRVSPVTTASLVASLALTHASGSQNVDVLVDPFSGRTVSGSVAWDANVLELVPAARLTYRATPGVSLVLDGGAGVGYTAVRARPSAAVASLAPVDPVDGGVGGVVRLAAGLLVTPTPNLRIALEALGLRLRFGNGPGSGFDLALSISHRL